MSLWYGFDMISWCIHEINGGRRFSIRCSKRQVACREVRVFQLFNIDVNLALINMIWIIVSIWFVYDHSLNNKFINSIVKVFFACILRISFLSFIINLVQIGAFMLFPQFINNGKNTVAKNDKIEIRNRSCCHSKFFKIVNFPAWELCNLYRLWRYRHDCKTVNMKMIKYYLKLCGSCH